MNKRAISKENLNCRTTKRLRKNSFCIGSVLIVAGIISTGFLALGEDTIHCYRKGRSSFRVIPHILFNSLIEPNFLLPLVLIARVAGIVLIVKPNFEALNGT
jgi:hypothetical protein